MSNTPQFFFLEKVPSLRNRTRLKGFIKDLFKREGVALENLTYIFCSDEYLLEINRSYLKHDYYTDIITFDLSPDKTAITGEIYISIDRVRDNAQTMGQSLATELHRVIFHGALHLCGYKDKTKADKAIMTQMEDKYLSLYL